jgi:hypothetical protein
MAFRPTEGRHGGGCEKKLVMIKSLSSFATRPSVVAGFVVHGTVCIG